MSDVIYGCSEKDDEKIIHYTNTCHKNIWNEIDNFNNGMKSRMNV